MTALVVCQLLFIISQACDYLFDETYNLTNLTLSDSIIFDNENEASIQFELKIIDECDDIKCNILKITQSQDTIFAIYLISNYLQISHVNNDNLDESILIPDIDQLLPVDGEYHSINIILTPTSKYVQIDNITHYQLYTTNPEQYQPLPLSSNQSSSFYLNTPPTATSIGYIKNICINSRFYNNITANISTTYEPSTTSAVSSANYILVWIAKSWMDSELFCQSEYDTHLATIIDEADFEEAIDLIIEIDSSDADVWIGFTDILNEGQWSYIDGTSCTQCTTEWEYWSPEEPNNYQDSSHCARIDARFIEENGGECQHLVANGSELSVLADSFCRSTNQYYPFLCNAPGGKYEAGVKCENLDDCWQELTYLNDTFVNQDLDDINAVIAYWNDTLFVIGNKHIHHTKFDLSDDARYNWESVDYDLEYTWDINMNSQQYVQYESSLYLYVENLNTSSPNLLHFDLETFDVTNYTLDIETEFEDTYSTCLVADDEKVYIIAPVPCTETTNVYTFNKEAEIGNKFQKYTPFTNEKISGAACAMSGDYVYIFGGRASTASTDIIKLNVNTWQQEEIYPPRRILHYFENARAITANNGKIYLYAYYYGESGNVFTFSRQLVFDPDTDQFETNFIDLNYDAPDSDAQAQLAVYSDNVLLLFDSLTKDNTTSFISYLVTDLVSINFESTTTDIWPSDGAIDIKYSLSDYTDLNITDLNDTEYIISFQCRNISNPIDALVIFYDNVCDSICDESMNDCYDCNQSLKTNITFNDANINQLVFDINPADNKTEDILILPEQITISLKRCNVTFYTNQTEIYHKYHENSIIHFQYNLSSTCYEEKDKNYSVSITSESVDNLEHQLTFSITDHLSHSCFFNGGDCNATTLSMQLLHTDLTQLSSFNILFESETIDLLIDDQHNFTIQNVIAESTNNDPLGVVGWSSIGIVGLVVLFGICCTMYRYRKYSVNVMNIKNALVIPIGIAFYEPDPDQPEFSGDLKDLDDGVPADIESCIKLFGDTLNYHIISDNRQDPKMQWTQNELITHLQGQAKYLDNNLNTYDALIVLISGHGIAGNILTSDYKKTPQMRIHRIFSKSGKARNIPRVFVFDCCSGNKERRKTTREMIEFERGKNFLTASENKEDEEEDDRPLRLSTVHWSSDENNPDFKLVTITAANEGYQSKMKKTGSYFIQSFMSQIYANQQVGNGGFCSCESTLYLSDMMQNIQNELESAGKQLPEYKCNNGTDKIIFNKSHKLNKTSNRRKVSEQIELNTTKLKNVVIDDDNSIEENAQFL